MPGLPTRWEHTLDTIYRCQLRPYARRLGLLDDEDNQQSIALYLLERDRSEASRFDQRKGPWVSYADTLGRRCLKRMFERRQHMSAPQELRVMATAEVERHTAQTIEEEQERAYFKRRPFRGHASRAA